MFQHFKKAVQWYCNEAAKNYVWSPLSPEAHKDSSEAFDQASK